MPKKYLQGLEKLYGKTTENRDRSDDLPVTHTKVAGKAKAATRPRIASEWQEQAALFTWLRKSKIPAFAIPNGGFRHLLEAINLKRAGLEPGVPDLMIPVMRSGYGGLFVEMKRSQGGKLSEHQYTWLEILRAQGYKCIVANGAMEAIEAVKAYLVPG